MSETPNGLRGEMAAACFDPGAYVGPRGARTTDQWRADACIAGPLAPILAQVSALQAEVEEVRRDMALMLVGDDEQAEVRQRYFDRVLSRAKMAEAEVERLQKVEGEREVRHAG